MIEATSFRQRLARNTAASVATNVWTIVLTLATLPLVLTGLGTRAFGIWVLLQTFNATNGWLSVPANGLGVSSKRDVATASSDRPDELGRAIGATFVCFAASGAAFALLLAFSGPFILRTILELGDEAAGPIRVMCLAFGVQVFAEHLSVALTSVLEGLQEVALARGIDALRKTAFAGAVVAAATIDGGLGATGVAAAAASLGVTVVALGLAARSRWVRPRRPRAHDLRRVVGYAGTVSLLQGTGVLYRTMDRTIAAVVIGPAGVALVEIANQIQLGSTALLSSSTYPMVSSAPWLRARGDEPALRALLDRLTRYSVLLTLPLVALIVAFAGPFIRVWLGADFTPAIGLTQVAVLSVALAAPMTAGSNLLQGAGHAGDVLRATAAAVTVNLVASVLLANAFGTVGVFWGTLVATLTVVPMLAHSIHRRAGVSSGRLAVTAVGRALPPTVIALGIGGATIASGVSDVTALLVGGTLALAGAIAGASRFSLSPEERGEILRAIRRR